MDDLTNMRSFISAVDQLDLPLVQPEIVDQPQDIEDEYNVVDELENIKFKLATYDCGMEGPQALGFEQGLVLATQMVDVLINKLRG